MKIRKLSENDYGLIIEHLNEWWGGRNMADMLPRLFFKYFSDTCFAVEENGKLIGFLVGFIAQNNKNIAYVHFIGIDPHFRKKGVGNTLYNHFFKMVAGMGCSKICAVTSVVNRNSLAFHTSIGFNVKESDTKIDGISYFKDYDGVGSDMFLFEIDNPYI